MPDFDRTGMDAIKRIKFLLDYHGYASRKGRERLAEQLRVSMTTLDRIIVNQPDRYIHELAFQLNSTPAWIKEGQLGKPLVRQFINYMVDDLGESKQFMVKEILMSLKRYE
jgi:hypothetical protein